MNRRRNGPAVTRSPRWTTTAPLTPILGVDIGRVISGDDTDSGGGSVFSDEWRTTPFIPGAVESLTRLNAASAFTGRIYLISKAGPKIEERTRAWLHEQRFFDRTGIPADHLFIVRERSDKAPICRRLGVTHVVDDRISVLATLDFVRAPLPLRPGGTAPGPARHDPRHGLGRLGGPPPPRLTPVRSSISSSVMTVAPSPRRGGRRNLPGITALGRQRGPRLRRRTRA